MPALNEARTIAGVVAVAAAHGTPIVVDDGSQDDTGDLARAAGAEVVRHAVNRGYDEALNSGFVRAAELGCDAVVTVDADGQHDPELVAAFVRELDAGADVVLGIRDRRQRVGESLFAVAAHALWGIDDPLCGMKAYRLDVWRELGHFDSYGSIGTELALFAVWRRKRISQVRVRTLDRSDSPRFGRRAQANYRIIRALVIGLVRSMPTARW